MTLSELRTTLRRLEAVRDVQMDLYDALKEFQQRAEQLDASDIAQSLKEIISNVLECVADDFDELIEQEQETHHHLQRTMRDSQ